MNRLIRYINTLPLDEQQKFKLIMECEAILNSTNPPSIVLDKSSRCGTEKKVIITKKGKSLYPF